MNLNINVEKLKELTPPVLSSRGMAITLIAGYKINAKRQEALANSCDLVKESLKNYKKKTWRYKIKKFFKRMFKFKKG